MRKRTAHRWQLTVIMLVGVFVAVGSFWLVQVVNQAGQEARSDQHRNEPDYIIDRFSMVRMNKAGQPAYIVSGEKLTHRPIDDSSDIDKPYVHSLSGDQPPMNIHADTAHVDQGIRASRLNGNVDVVRPGLAEGAGDAHDGADADRVPGRRTDGNRRPGRAAPGRRRRQRQRA